MKPTVFAAAALGVFALAAASQSPAQQPAAPSACNPGNAAKFICGQRNPEDLVTVPGTDWIIGSGMAVANQPGSGGLVMIDRKTHTAVRLPAPSGPARAPFAAGCPNPPNVATFSAHGLNIRPAGRGKSTLYVVGHGSREAIEVFDVVNTKGAPAVKWAGCVMAPAGAFMNSVAVLGDGRIVMTDFYHSPTTMADAQQGRNTGAIYVARPGGPFEKLPGTDLPGPNGIEVSPDGKYVYVADWGRSAVKRYELAAPQKEPWSMTLTFRADNLRWAPDGKLLLAGPGADPNCATGQRCPQIPVVGALDTSKLTLTYLKRGPAEPSMGGVSSALVVADELWTASYTGDRVGYQALAK